MYEFLVFIIEQCSNNEHKLFMQEAQHLSGQVRPWTRTNQIVLLFTYVV